VFGGKTEVSDDHPKGFAPDFCLGHRLPCHFPAATNQKFGEAKISRKFRNIRRD
jgi:hypothetical protein